MACSWLMGWVMNLCMTADFAKPITFIPVRPLPHSDVAVLELHPKLSRESFAYASWTIYNAIRGRLS